MIDSLGDVGSALNSANPDRLRKLYEQLRLELILELIFDGDARTADVATDRVGARNCADGHLTCCFAASQRPA